MNARMCSIWCIARLGLSPAPNPTLQQVLLKALKLLNAAAAVPDTEHLHAPGWHNVVFRIVPLLSASQTAGSAEVLDSALDVLVSLSEHAHFGNMFYASGCIAPLLALLGSANCGLAQSASCILSALAEGGLSRDKLCQDTALLPMMRALKANHCVVVTIGACLVARLRQRRARHVWPCPVQAAVPGRAPLTPCAASCVYALTPQACCTCWAVWQRTAPRW